MAGRCCEDAGVFAQDVAAVAEPTDKFAMQAEFAKTTFEASLSNVRESQEMASKTANKTVDIMSKRFVENLDVMMQYVKKTTPKATVVAQ